MRVSLAGGALVGALGLACVGALAAAEPGGAAAEVLATDRLWAESLVKGDVKALDGLYADDLVYVHSGGNIETKAEFLDRMRSGARRYQKLELVDPRVRVYGTAAVVNGVFEVLVQSDGAPLNHRVVYTHVYARQGDRWRMVAHQTTRPPVPSPAPSPAPR